ncbi:MAG TPA: ParB/RepB/Spo0J family partition protein [Dermatophilaceae bacterium]|nr:ParB/RepB/Spo0J family partition protein [Dermatophilaceae bacterium]
MSEKRRALGRGLGALIPSAPAAQTAARPVDVFFKDHPSAVDGSSSAGAPHVNGRDGIAVGASPGASNGSGAHMAGDAALDGQHGSNSAPNGAAGTEQELAPVPGASFAELPVDWIRPNPRQPRSVFDEDEMAELVNSIKEIGVLQPVVVRPIPDSEQDGGSVRYELIMGERRWRASLEAGKETVPAIIKETTDDVLLRDALLENLHRSQLNALEEAAAYQQLLEDFGCTQEELASRIHRSRPQISNTLRLLKLPPLVARRVAAGVLSAGHARALLTLNDGAAMERLAQRIVAEGLSVRSVEEIVALSSEDRPTKSRRPRAGTRHPQLDDVAARLADQLETRVAIALGQRKGKVTIEFASVEDLNRILDVMGMRGSQN